MRTAIATIASEALALSRLYAKRCGELQDDPDLLDALLAVARELKRLRLLLKEKTSKLTSLTLAELRVLGVQLGIRDVYSYRKYDLALEIERMTNAMG